MAQVELITAIVDSNIRPQKPNLGSHAQAYSPLTEEVRAKIEECWAPIPATRPSTAEFLRCFV